MVNLDVSREVGYKCDRENDLVVVLPIGIKAATCQFCARNSLFLLKII